MKTNEIPGQMSIFDMLKDDPIEELPKVEAPETVTKYGVEWFPIDVKPEGITEADDLEVLGTYCINNSERWSQCPACLIDGVLKAQGVPWDIPRPTWKYWRVKQKKLPVIIKGLCDDAYCPKCDYALDEIQSCNQACPKCHTPLDWTPWHKLNDDWYLKHLKNLDVNKGKEGSS